MTGTGVKQSTNITTAKPASHRRPVSSGMSSSWVRGWCGPKKNIMTSIMPVHTIHDIDTTESARKHRMVA